MYANKTPGYFDKPYHNMIKFDEKKIADLFIRINKMDTHDIKQFSLIESIPLTVTNNEGNNLIHQVLLNDDNLKTELQRLNMIKYLYTENVNPNAPNGNNITPLHIACRKQFDAIVTYLLELGVDVNYKDNNGSTPFHYLLAGKIKIEEKQEKKVQSLIVPKQKKIDKDYVDRWQLERGIIWGNIRDSPYLKAITDTIKYTMFYNDGINTIKDFQEELYRVNTKDNGVYKMNKMKELKDLRDSSLNKFRNQIKSKWKIEPINEIKIHPTEENSWPQSGDAANNLSVVKDSNVYEHIKKNLDKSVASLNETNKPVDLPKKNNVNEIYNDKKNKLELEGIDYNNIDSDTYKDDKHDSAIDFASDIIDWDKYTFLGGSRQVRIINEIPETMAGNNDINSLLSYPLEKIIYIMAYGLVDPNIATIHQYYDVNAGAYTYAATLGNPIIIDLIIEYITKIILDTCDLEFEQRVINGITTLGNNNYKYLLELIEKRDTSNKISWLYTFILTLKSKYDFINRPNLSDLIVEINQIFIYLISAYANCKNDMLLSIHQVFKAQLIRPLIYNTNGFGVHLPALLPQPINNYDLGFVYSTWIYLLLTNDINYAIVKNNIAVCNGANFNIYITGLPISESLKDIIIYTYNYFNNNNYNLNINWLNVSDTIQNKISFSEKLCCMIIKYYTDMEQKPLLQNVVDTISLIRYRSINTGNDPVTKQNILDRLLTLYEAPFINGLEPSGFNITPGLQINGNNPVPTHLLHPVGKNNDTNTLHQVDTVLPRILTNALTVGNPLRKFFNIFNINKEKSVELFLLEYSLPSKINYYLSQGYDYIDTIPDPLPLQIAGNPNPEYGKSHYDKIHYLLKKIEASHLGLCFMGVLPKINIEVDTNPPIERVTGTTFPVGTVLTDGSVIVKGTVLNGSIFDGTGGSENVFPDGTVLPDGIILPANAAVDIIPPQAMFPNSLTQPIDNRAGVGALVINGQITFQAGTTIPSGTVFPEGTFIDNTTTIGNGTIFPKGTIINAGSSITFNAVDDIQVGNNFQGFSITVAPVNIAPGGRYPLGVAANRAIEFAQATTLAIGTSFPKGIQFALGTVITAGTIFPDGTIIKDNTIIPIVGGVGVAWGITHVNAIILNAVFSPSYLPINNPGAAIGVNITLPVGSYIPVGTKFPKGTIIRGLTNIIAGTILPIGTILKSGTNLPLNTIISPETFISVKTGKSKIITPDTKFIANTVFPLGCCIMPGCYFPDGTDLLNGTILPNGTEITTLKKTIRINSHTSKQYLDLKLPNDAMLPIGTVLKRGFTFIKGSRLVNGTIFPAGSILSPDTEIEEPSPDAIIPLDNSYFSMYFYNNRINYPIKDRRFFYTNSIETLFRPPTKYSYEELLNRNNIKMTELRNRVTSIITKTMKDFQLTTKSSTYASIIGYCYPLLLAISTWSELIKKQYDEYKTTVPIPIDIFKIKDFETHVNSINTNLYLSYYLKTPNDGPVEIPKFIYHQLGKNTEIIFNDNNDIKYIPGTLIPGIADNNETLLNSNPIIDSNQTDFVPAGRDKTGSPMNEISSYHNVITGIKEGRYFINKRLLDTNFKKTKTTKLPPSFDNPEALSLFYKLNTIQLITSNIVIIQNIDQSLIREENLQPDIIDTQKLLIGAKMIEELVSMYLKSKIYEIGLSIYNTVIRNKLADNLMTPDETELLFDNKYKFDVNINEKPSLNLVQSINRQRVLEKLLMNYSPFTRIDDSIRDIFYIYPSDYNGTNLLKSKYRVTIKDSLIETIARRGNIFIHNNEMSSPLTYLIKNTYYPGLRLLATAIGVLPRNPILPILNLNILRLPLQPRQPRQPNETSLYSMYQSNSPFTYLFEQYKNHVNKFTNGRNIKEYIQNFVKPQFDEIKNIIQANDLYNNNILVNLELSFSMCNYLCQQYLSDYMFRYRYNFVASFNNRYPDLFLNRMKNKKSVYYIECIIYDIIIFNSNNHNNILNSIVENYKLELNNITQKIKKNKKEETFNYLSRIDVTLIRQEINTLTTDYNRLRQIISILRNIQKPTIDTADIRNGVDAVGYRYDKIIERYDKLFPLLRNNRNNINRDELRNSYIDGWKQLLEKNSNNNPDLIISRILREENSELTKNNPVTNIQDMDNFINENIGYYQFMHDFVKTYFEKPFYKKDNEILIFVYDMLLHLTQNILCNSIEQIIRKILFQSINNTNFMLPNDDNNFTKIMNRVDYIITNDIKRYLYGEVAQKLVINSVSIFDDAEEKESYETQTTTEILNSFLDLLVAESPIELHENTLTILKSNIVPYFDTITNRTINNWAVCAENMFLYLINHFRLLETMSASL